MKPVVLTRVHFMDGSFIHMLPIPAVSTTPAWDRVAEPRTPVKTLEYEFRDGKLREVSPVMQDRLTASNLLDFLGSMPTAFKCPHCNHTLEPNELIEGRCFTCEADLSED